MKGCHLKKGPILKRNESSSKLSSFKEKIVRSFQEICWFPALSYSLKNLPTNMNRTTGVIILSAQTMHIKKGKSLENYHRFVKVWFRPKWVLYNDPRNNLTHFFWSDREVSLHHAERRAVPLPPSLAKGSICGWQKSVTLHPPRMPVEN